MEGREISMADNQNRCMNCMEPLEGNLVCPFCGFDNRQATQQIFPQALSQGTLLADGEYLVGNAIKHNGEGFTYIGFSESRNQKIWIHEFMPDTLVKRIDSQDEVLPFDGFSTQYKTQKMDFSDIYVALKNLPNKTGLFPVLDCFEQNNTVYSIETWMESITLDELLQGSHVLNVNQTMAIFDPLFRALSRLHMNNVVHRGISPENIRVDQNGDLRLTGFAIPAIRTARGELPAELYEGYSAPEQYDVTTWQGTWTDVYSLSAVLYRTLGGEIPESAEDRLERDRLKPLSVISENIPKSVDYAIAHGMKLNTSKRVETIDTFIELFHYGPDSSNDPDKTQQVDMNRIKPVKKDAPSKKKSKNNTPIFFATLIITVIILIMAIVIIVNSFTKNMIPTESKSSSQLSGESSDNSNISTVSSMPSTFTVPNLEGVSVEAIKKMDGYDQYFTLEITEKYSETIPEDAVMKQDIPQGTVLSTESITKIKVEVSKGQIEIDEAKFVNFPKTTLVQYLTDNGIEASSIKETEEFSDTVAAGNVIRIIRIDGYIGIIVSKGADTSKATTPSYSQNTSSDDGNYWHNWNKNK